MQDRLHVCYVSLMFAPLVGGAERRTEKLARQILALGHDVVIVTLRHERQWRRKDTLSGLPVVRVGGIYRRDGRLRIGRLGILPINLAVFVTLWRLRHQYDVIHVGQVSPLAAVAAFTGKLAHKPVVIAIQSAGPTEAQRAQLEQGATLMIDTLTDTSFLTVDAAQWQTSGDIDHLPRAMLGGRMLLQFLRRSNAYYQVLSTRCHADLLSRGFRADHIVHIPGSVDIEKFQPPSEGRLSPTVPERDIICVSRLTYPKGVDVLVHAWGRMMGAPDDWRMGFRLKLRVVGDGALMRPLERIVDELGIADSVELLGLRADIVDLLQHSWAFVLPSRWEGMPNALLEAMACELPCVATRVSGSEDIIYDGVTGLLVEPENPTAMALALRRIIEDVGLARRLGQQARLAVTSRYQLATIAERCTDLYRALLAQEPPAQSSVLEGRASDAWERASPRTRRL